LVITTILPTQSIKQEKIKTGESRQGTSRQGDVSSVLLFLSFNLEEIAGEAIIIDDIKFGGKGALPSF